MKKETIFEEEAMRERKPWPRATKVGNWIFMSVAGTGDDGKPVGPTIEEQATYAYEEMKKTLESLGSSMDNIVQRMTYYTNIEDVAKTRPIWQKYISPDQRPAGAAVEVKSLVKMEPPLLIEVSVIAIIPDE